ncbi:caspase, EACC1-associated type [Saccharopolyspora cebuensis]|uniref:FtsK/SpoIIIE domain-containing protein n=1 Tax=Saccharopolyspora cebuensis TaxID=418759 RepID=A0ABV4CCI5_9PSEU
MRLALLIATSMYADPGLRALRAPADEAEELRQVLLAQGDFDQVEVLRNESRSQLERAVDDVFRNAGPGDLVLLYLSCHGLKDDRGNLVFAACNTELDRPDSTALTASFVRERVHASQASTKVLLLDCCYSGAFSLSGAKSSALVDHAQLTGRGTFLLTATSALEYAYEDDRLTDNAAIASSLFTDALLEGIRTGAADADGDGLITGEELYLYVAAKLAGRQSPQRTNDGYGTFYVARTGGTVPAPPSTADLPEVSLGELLGDPLRRPDEPLGRTAAPVVGVRGAAGEPFTVDFAAHNLVVLGPSGSGKSRFLRTVLLGLAAGADPSEVRISCVDSESRFGAFARLDHVDAVVGPDEHEAIGRVVAAAGRTLAARRALFRERDFDSVRDFRAARRNGELDDAHPDLFLVLDRWEPFADHNPDLVREVVMLARDGLQFGLHVVATARRASDLPPRVHSQLTGRIELGEGPARSHTGPFRPALPRLGRHSGRIAEDVASVEEYGRPVPRTIGPAGLRDLGLLREPAAEPARPPLRIPLGVDRSGRPVVLDLRTGAATRSAGAGPHGLVVGRPGARVAQTVRAVVTLLALAHSPAELSLALLGSAKRNELRGLVDLPHCVLDRAVPLPTGLDRVQREINRRRAAEPGSWSPLVVTINLEFPHFSAPRLMDKILAVMRSGGEVDVHVLLHGYELGPEQPDELLDLCGFRIVHRTTARAESWRLLGSGAAAEATDVQGLGWLKRADDPPVRFQGWEPNAEFAEELRALSDAPTRAEVLADPLDGPITLADVLGEPSSDPVRGASTAAPGADRLPVGIVDDFERATTAPLTLPVGRNLLISGPPRSGRSSAARTAVLALALSRTPEELVFYFLGRGDGFSCGDVLAALPHVAGTASFGSADAEAAAMIREITAVLGAREAGEGGPAPLLYLVVEPWHVMVDRFGDLAAEIERIAERGARFGVHVIAVVEPGGGGPDLPTRWELSREAPGTGVLGGARFRLALPWFEDEGPEPSAALARRIAEAWPGFPARASAAVTAPPVVPYSAGSGSGLRIGWLEREGAWLDVDLDETAHLLCVGSRSSGTGSLLRVVHREVERLHPGSRVVVLDPRRELLGEFPAWLSYLAVPSGFRAAVEPLLAELGRRSRGGRWDRRVFLLVADAELIAPEVLDGLVDHLAEGARIGFHLVLTHNSVNQAGALRSGVAAALRDAGCTAVVLNGDPRDGELWPGVVATAQPPGRGRALRPGREPEVVRLSWPDAGAPDPGEQRAPAPDLLPPGWVATPPVTGHPGGRTADGIS